MSKRGPRPLLAEAERLGYCYDGTTRNGHLRWRNKHGRIVITGSDLSEDRTLKNARAQLRQKADEGELDGQP
jgi:hypothetical protein